MALITDPDNLSQGAENVVGDLAFTASAGAVTTLTGAASLPAIAAGEFFEIRDSSTVGNNGLYEETGGSPTTSSIVCTKVVGPNPVDLAAESTSVLGTTGAGSEKSVHFDTPTLTWYLLEQGNLSVDGVTGLAQHSFFKEEWKSDNFLIGAAGFPMTVISEKAGQYVFGQDPSGNNNGWKPAEDDASPVIKTRRLIRNAGWEEIDNAGITQLKFFNVTTLPTTLAFEDPADQAWYRFGTDATDLTAAIDFEFTGEVNEPVEFFRQFGNPGATTAFATATTITRTTGSFVTDGYQIGGGVNISNAEDPANDGTEIVTAIAALTLTCSGASFTTNADDTTVRLAIDNKDAFESFLRIRDADPNGKLFAKADLAAGGETQIDPKIIKLGLGNSADLDITATDATIAGGEPWTEIRMRYLPADFNLPVDSAALRAFGIVIDVGTYSRSNGVSNGTTLVTSADHVLGLGESLADYAAGTLILHDATAPDRTSHTISTIVDNAGTLEITLTGALTNTESNLSFSVQRATPVVANRNQIWEKMQYQMRQALDIDGTNNVVNGKTADVLGVFEGLNLRLGKVAPVNPNGGGSGVMIIGFDANDTNNLFFFDNTATQRNFPFVAAGSLVFNQRSVDDTDGEFWLYFQYTRRTTNSDIDTVGPSADTYDLEGTLGTYLVNDYLQISGFVQAENNGLFIVTVVNVSGSDYTVRKVDGTNVGTAETNQTVSVDENPYPSPDAIQVNDNGGSPIVGNIGTVSVSFDFDYDNNGQGGRTAASDAVVVLVAGGLETIQMARTDDDVNTISRAVGLSFSLGPALERNYSNP